MKKILAGVLTAASVLCAAAFGGCVRQDTQTKTYFYMNAYARLIVKGMGVAQFNNLAEEVDGLLAATENSISTTKATSSVRKFNLAEAGTDVEIDKTCYDVMTVAKAVYEQSGGAYNPAVWYSEDLYGFAPRLISDPDTPYDRASVQTLPDQKYIEAFQTLASYFDGVTLREDTASGKYYAYKPQNTVTVDGDPNEYSLRIDLGGVGKGWVCDRISEAMDGAGVKYGYFDFGSSSLSMKSYDGTEEGEYTLSPRDPRATATAYASFSVKDKRLSTSGDYEAYYTVDGVRYCHIIDPATGSPIRTGVASVTVVGGSAAEDDAYTTALSAMGKKGAADFINENLSDRLVVMLYIGENGGEIITNRPQEITVLTPEYALANTVLNGKIILN